MTARRVTQSQSELMDKPTFYLLDLGAVVECPFQLSTTSTYLTSQVVENTDYEATAAVVEHILDYKNNEV
jgi:hypothetical protein